MDIVIFDIEATCEDRSINPHYKMETIEIGAVKIRDGKVIEEFEEFIKPKYVDNLTPYCTELTGITYDDLEDAYSFNDVILDFYSFIHGCEIYSCGDFDKIFLTKELKEKGDKYIHQLASNAIRSSHVNLKTHYSKITGDRKRDMLKMAEFLNVEIEGTHHRALSDARNLTNIFLELESIRERHLRQAFSDVKMNSIIINLNKLHNYDIQKIKGVYYSKSIDYDTVEEYNFLDFLDSWKDVIAIDNKELNLGYVNRQDLKVLNKYTK